LPDKGLFLNFKLKKKAMITPENTAIEVHLIRYNREITDAVEEIMEGKYLTQDQVDSLLIEW
jgi:hypothetical protein